jgi:hypothetical protein
MLQPCDTCPTCEGQVWSIGTVRVKAPLEGHLESLPTKFVDKTCANCKTEVTEVLPQDFNIPDNA